MLAPPVPSAAATRQALTTTPRSGSAEAVPGPGSGTTRRGPSAVQVHLLGDHAGDLRAAKLVPLQRAQPAVLLAQLAAARQRSSTSSKNVLTTSTAGVQASTHGPKLENAARPPRSRAPTATTPGSAAG